MNLSEMLTSLGDKALGDDLRELHDALLDSGNEKAAEALRRVFCKRKWAKQAQCLRGWLFKVKCMEGGDPIGYGYTASRPRPSTGRLLEVIPSDGISPTQYVVLHGHESLPCVQGWEAEAWTPRDSHTIPTAKFLALAFDGGTGVALVLNRWENRLR